ncbi:MAG: sulfatase [Planctomycetota bacterium]
MLRTVAAFALALGAAMPAVAGERPNILFFLVDDLGWTDVGCFGSTFYETPAIDRLAATGAKLTNAYAACPVCSPTRVSIQTGKYPARLKTTDFFGARQPQRWNRNTRLLPALYLERLPAEETTIAEALRDAGYQTFFAGKWHLGPEGSWPEDHGYDVNRGGCQWGAPGGGKRYFSPYGNPRLTDGPEGELLTDRLADETCAYVRDATSGENANRPFFAMLSFYTVHTPLMAKDDKVARYKAKREAGGGKAAEKWLTDRPGNRIETRQVRLVQNHAIYAAMVEQLDVAVGRVLKTLDEAGVADETIVVFTSDNGGLSSSEGSPTSNLPLRTGKGWMYEGGIREPTLVRWPGVTKAGDTIDAVVTSADYYPTLLEAAGLPAAPEQTVDGRSFAAALRGEAYERGPAYWHYPHYGNQGGAPAGAVRHGKWKLIEWYEDGLLELFNLDADPGEQTNLATAEPARVAELKAQLDAWRSEADVAMPTPNPKYKPKTK